ncbi:penicillin-binding protein 2 [Larkinella rosea]|uniref:Penicillin-binding protein 2 n=1 Tax=Larkinella rosea TaxID=2025312 RepID=A0A3P1BMN1_9BACT|nr:penicillin-binding protein 2 [Larkinella rosea]RRB02288.1 penicillin-binding protein 2 [Larkinella rosea]
MIENRKYIVIGVFCLVGLVYLLRLFYLQILDDSYSLESSSNSIKRIIEIPYRGQIYDRSGKFIVYNTPVYDLYVTPKKVQIADTAAFCRLMELERSEFDSIMNNAKSYSYVKPSLFLRQLSKEDFARIQDALVDYRGFEHVTSSMRTYPAHTLANALGYVSEISKKQLDEQETPYYRQGDYIGRSGLEQQYESVLRGQRGVKFVMQNVHQVVKGSWKNGAFDSLAVAGKNLYTGIDVEIQQYADTLMQNKVGSVVAIEPSTGQILAMVSAPTYDPNSLSSRFFSKSYAKLAKNPYKPLINRPVMASYRPGSTFKLIQAMVALQDGAVAPSSIFSHAGSPMKCHCNRSGRLNLAGAVQYSCNPYFYHVFRRLLYNNNERNTFKASAMGLHHWHDMVSKFGIGQKLGVDLPGELKGSLPDADYYNRMYGENHWKFSTVYSLSIGEGELLINPLKMANVAAIVANRGWFYTPHIVSGIGKPGEGIDPKYLEKHEVGIDPRHFEILAEGMQGAVEHGTTTMAANIPGITICGKTGTSQNKKGKDHSIFVAFAPRENPKIAIAVFVENAGWGGIAAASVASLVIEKYIKRRVDNHALDKKVKESNYLPAVTLPKKPAPKKYEMPKDSAAKPLIVKTIPQQPTPVPVEPKSLASRPVTTNGN